MRATAYSIDTLVFFASENLCTPSYSLINSINRKGLYCMQQVVRVLRDYMRLSTSQPLNPSGIRVLCSLLVSLGRIGAASPRHPLYRLALLFSFSFLLSFLFIFPFSTGLFFRYSTGPLSFFFHFYF